MYDVEAELWGMLRALELGWERGWRKMELQTDAQTAISLLSTSNSLPFRWKNTVNKCKILLVRD